jgi:hypothetical protein
VTERDYYIASTNCRFSNVVIALVCDDRQSELSV